ncbi:recombinase family protein [Variovorax sp. EBFNA2]|uniref:recombinase family protein n=1 Tax=Variovorax sp. EBFNA2 TaxID=3342097 RepID=UPI0029BFF5E9|nr:recombinase family protein [Variovorax boronicumulans]WPG35117.1 recombinase family protein [Variovorax boronicumulans]
MTAKVYSYMRFSDARQAGGASSERQGAYAAAWAREHSLLLDETLSMRDEGLSAFHQRHVKKGALGVFLKAVEDGKVPAGSYLVVEGLDRLSRAEPIQAQAQLTAIISAGISVVTASDGKVYSRDRLKANPMDLVYSLLVMIRAHEESDTKSKRVRDAIRRQCQGWIAGTYRGLIRYGKAPGWLHVVDGRWEVIPERTEAIRTAVDMFRRGLGTGHIAKTLHDAGLSMSAGMPTSGHLVRLLANPALKGEKHLVLEPDTHVLEGYYPAVIDADVWNELQQLVGLRSRRHVRGQIPSLLTGFGVAVCGYCGSPMKSQTMANKRRNNGTLADGHRRLQCVRVNSGESCAVKGSCSSAPIERALMRYCSDMVNLQSLYEGDRGALPRSELAVASARLQEIETKLERITEALLESTEGAPTTFIRRARELEADRDLARNQVKLAERAMAEAARSDLTGADERWKALIEGVENLDYEARMRARQLVADTFERIVVYHRGMRPAAGKNSIDVILQAKGGTARQLRITADNTLTAWDEVASTASL